MLQKKPRYAVPPSVELVRGREGFAALAGEWDRLLGKSPGDSVFLTYEWIDTWWRAFGRGRELFILTLRDQYGRLACIAPFMRSEQRMNGVRMRAISFIGAGGEAVPSHLNIITAPGSAAWASERVFDTLMENDGEWDMLHLTDMAEDSPFAMTLTALSRRMGLRCVVDAGSVCPYIPSQPTWEEFEKTLDSKMKSEMRRKLKKLTADHDVRFITSIADPGDALETYFALHVNRWEGAGSTGLLGSHENVDKFHRSLVQKFNRRGWLRFYFLMIDNEPAAAVYGFEYGGKFYGYNTGFDKKWSAYGVVKLLMRHIVEDTINRGLAEYDLLCGDHPYKHEWTDRKRRLLDVTVWNDNRRASLHRAVNTAYNSMKAIIKSTPLYRKKRAKGRDGRVTGNEGNPTALPPSFRNN
jgi:CelD/BcsL family acetyltransferase involved in cellulose biosynthesis